MATQAQSRNATRASALNLLSDQILETIYESGLTSNINEADKEALKQESNRLSNEIESQKQMPPMDPLARLPPEVWTEIIQEATEENWRQFISDRCSAVINTHKSRLEYKDTRHLSTMDEYHRRQR